MVLSSGSLLDVVTAAATVGSLRQAALPHPDAVSPSSRCPPSGAATSAGPLLLRLELPPDGHQQQQQLPPPERNKEEEFLGRLAVTVMPRSVAAGQALGRLRMFAQEGGRRGRRL